MSRNDKQPGGAEAAPSKSQRRREAMALKSLAAELIALRHAEFARMPIEEPLRGAIADARRIRSHIARKRQLQYVAKLLRRMDVNPLFDALQAIRNEALQLSARQHRVEEWRDLLLEQGDAAVTRLAERRHDTDIQALRQLLRNARHEAARGRPPAAARSLFRMLRSMDEREALPIPDPEPPSN